MNSIVASVRCPGPPTIVPTYLRQYRWVYHVTHAVNDYSVIRFLTEHKYLTDIRTRYGQRQADY